MTLEEKIVYHQKKYYNNEPEISDAEFDALWDQLKKENPDSEILASIGETSWSGWPKAKHKMVMGSQDKFNNEEDFLDWLRVKKIIFPLILQHKLDGLSIELQYENGVLIKAVTRGDGEVGDDVTPNVEKMKGVPIEIDVNFSGSIRGEIVLDNATFEEHFKDSKNPRNMASGITKRKSGVESEYLTVVTYDVFDAYHTFTTEQDKISFLQDNDFISVYSIVCPSPQHVLDYRDHVIKERDRLNVAIDGIVLKQDKIVQTDLLRKRPEYQRAFKFETEQVITKLINVEWSRSGHNYTPVAILEPVDLMGSTVKRASLANLDNMAKLDIYAGCDVVIHKAGEIIPQILKVVKKDELPTMLSDFPTNCEVCDSKLVVTGARVYCPNLDCGGRKFHRLEKWIDKTGVKGFGPALMNHLFDEGFVEDIVDLYTLNLEEVLASTNLKKATAKAFANLYEINSLKLETFVSGFDIEGIGEGVVKFAVDSGINTLEKLKNTTFSAFMRIDGFSSSRAELLYDAMQDLYEEMLELTEYIEIELRKEKVEIMDKLNGQSFCFTGKLENMTRTEAQAMVADKGGVVKSGVGKGLDFLVTNDPTSGSSKNTKAESLGTKLITEGQFMRMLI